MDERISVEALRGLKFAFEDDLYSVAEFLLRYSDAKCEQSKRSGTITRSRPTLHGVASAYARLAFDVSSDSVRRLLTDAGLPLGATVQFEQDMR